MNFNDLKKENLIYVLLRSPKSLYENNYLKHIKNDTDDRIKAKINIIRIELAQLENVITKEYRDKIRKALYEIENQTGVTEAQKNEIYNSLSEFSRDLDMIRKYGYSDSGTNDIEFLFSNPDDSDRPILAKHAFDRNYEFYMCKGNKNKELQTNQFIDIVIPYLAELIDEKKVKNQKVQLDIGINVKHMQDPEKNYAFYVKSKNIEMILLNNLLIHFMRIMKKKC